MTGRDPEPTIGPETLRRRSVLCIPFTFRYMASFGRSPGASPVRLPHFLFECRVVSPASRAGWTRGSVGVTGFKWTTLVGALPLTPGWNMDVVGPHPNDTSGTWGPVVVTLVPPALDTGARESPNAVPVPDLRLPPGRVPDTGPGSDDSVSTLVDHENRDVDDDSRRGSLHGWCRHEPRGLGRRTPTLTSV